MAYRKPRKIVVDGHTIWWSLRGSFRPCRRTLRVWAPERSGVHCAIQFAAPNVRCKSHDPGGVVWIDGECINLNKPSTVSRLIRAALVAGWEPGIHASNLSLDGVELWSDSEGGSP